MVLIDAPRETLAYTIIEKSKLTAMGDVLMKLLRLIRWVSLLSLILAFLPLLGIPASPAYADSTAFVRIIHASPDIGTADIFVDGTKLLSSFQFGAVTSYVRVPIGPHLVQVAAIGKGPGAAIITQTLSIGASVPYTVAATGTNATNLSLQVFTDDNLLSANGQAKIRMYNLAPDAGSISIATNGQTVISGLSYPQASDYQAISAGSYTLNVAPSQENTTVQMPETLPANTITSIFSVGLLYGTPTFQLVTSQVPGTPNWPGTGSDPNPLPADSQPLNLWLLWIAVLAVIGAAGVTSSRLVTHSVATRLRHYQQQ